jgi:hypothetical protein
MSIQDVNNYPYVYVWGNNKKRITMKGRRCKVLARSNEMNSRLIEFENGQREVVSGNSLRICQS